MIIRSRCLHYFKCFREHKCDLLLYNSLQLLTVFNFIDENDQLKVMCEHRDLLLYNSLQLLTVFNFIDDEHYQLKVMCEHRCILLYNSLQLLLFLTVNDQLKVM